MSSLTIIAVILSAILLPKDLLNLVCNDGLICLKFCPGLKVKNKSFFLLALTSLPFFSLYKASKEILSMSAWIGASDLTVFIKIFLGFLLELSLKCFIQMSPSGSKSLSKSRMSLLLKFITV